MAAGATVAGTGCNAQFPDRPHATTDDCLHDHRLRDLQTTAHNAIRATGARPRTRVGAIAGVSFETVKLHWQQGEAY
jgi:hypothetical protein